MLNRPPAREITREDLNPSTHNSDPGTLTAPVAPFLFDNTIHYKGGDTFVTISISYPQMAAGQALNQHLQFISTDGSKASKWTFTHTLTVAEAKAKKATWEIAMALFDPENYSCVNTYYVVTLAAPKTSKSLELMLAE